MGSLANPQNQTMAGRNRAIFADREAGGKYTDIAPRYGISKSRAAQIVARQKRLATLPSVLSPDVTVIEAAQMIERPFRYGIFGAVANSAWGCPSMTLRDLAKALRDGLPKTPNLAKRGIRFLRQICAEAGCDVGDEPRGKR